MCHNFKEYFAFACVFFCFFLAGGGGGGGGAGASDKATPCL